jgi:hypothetical protein
MNEYKTYYCGVGHLRLTYWYFHQNYPLVMGQEVWLMNPRSVRQKVALGTVSGISGQHRFHFMEIPVGWMKVDITEVLASNVMLMMENRDAEQEKVKDAVGSSVLWNQKFMKCKT